MSAAHANTDLRLEEKEYLRKYIGSIDLLQTSLTLFYS